jgi:hypothetical protein
MQFFIALSNNSFGNAYKVNKANAMFSTSRHYRIQRLILNLYILYTVYYFQKMKKMCKFQE